MSVEHIKGDLLTFPHGITVAGHCANCRCTLGNLTATGIAGAIGKLYPAAAAADKQAFDEGNARLGLLSVAQIEGGRRIVNLYGQDSYGRDRRHLDYEGGVALPDGVQPGRRRMECGRDHDPAPLGRLSYPLSHRREDRLHPPVIHYRPLGDVRDDLRRSYQAALAGDTPTITLTRDDAFVVLRALGAVKRQRRSASVHATAAAPSTSSPPQEASDLGSRLTETPNPTTLPS